MPKSVALSTSFSVALSLCAIISIAGQLVWENFRGMNSIGSHSKNVRPGQSGSSWLIESYSSLRRIISDQVNSNGSK